MNAESHRAQQLRFEYRRFPYFVFGPAKFVGNPSFIEFCIFKCIFKFNEKCFGFIVAQVLYYGISFKIAEMLFAVKVMKLICIEIWCVCSTDL
jgi:hypothetical protein